MRFAPRDALGVQALTSAHCDAVLAQHRCQERSNDCGPFCAAMVIHALTGRALDPVALARAMDRPRAGGFLGILPLVRRWPGSATFPWGMVDLFRQHGLAARWTFRGRAGDLRAGLGEGKLYIPVTGAYRPRPWAHYMVLLAHDPERGWGFADPASPEARLSWRSEAAFAERWGNYGRLVIEVGKGDAT